jgi:hypothetical protein
MENASQQLRVASQWTYRDTDKLLNEFGSSNISLSRLVKVLYYLKFLFKAAIIKKA